VAWLLDVLRRAGALQRRDHDRASPPAWDAAYRNQLVPWATDACDADIVTALAEHAPPHDASRHLLDVGCGLGQVARHAADAGYRVVATDFSEAALAAARDAAGARDIVWLRDDICATGLVGPFEVVVDRATLHTLPRSRAFAWAAAIAKLAAPGATLIIKAHRAGIPNVTRGYSAVELGELLPGFAIIAERDAELPGITDDKPIVSTLFVLKRR
jgi:SAM-dependent methyltransferase